MSKKCNKYRLFNSICKRFYQAEYFRFISIRDKEDIKTAQMNYLGCILRDNKKTFYGKKYQFANIDNYEQFAEQVPLTIYEDYEPYIERISAGEKHILTWEDVQLFELTSGSTKGKKLIPYTKTLKQEFQRGIKPWLYNLYNQVEGIIDGQSYWSITPITGTKEYAACGIPIGFEEDVEYFGRIEKYLFRQIFAVDSSVKFSQDMHSFYLITIRQLLACESLTLISVWSPTFLLILCDFIRENEDLCLLEVPKERHSELKEALSHKDFSKIFKDLRVISCWADGAAKDHIQMVQEYFPGVYIQPKGLLATECFVSFPLVHEEGSRLSIFSHFFEFRSLKDGKLYLTHQLEIGEYEVIVTTGGGLYRYCLRDVIEVIGSSDQHIPRIRFLRRSGITSDLFGEKLTQEFVLSVIQQMGIHHPNFLLAPSVNEFGKTQYCLYIQEEMEDLRDKEKLLEQLLCESYHYQYCRELGQLSEASIKVVQGTLIEGYSKRFVAEGMRLGDIKFTHLSSKTDWDKWFEKY